MFFPPNIRIDRLSFWLGFLAASLLWWLWMRARPLLPLWRKQIRQYLTLLQQRNLSGLENAAMREVLRRAQRAHLAAPLFPLDALLIEPKLLAPPLPHDYEGPATPSIASQVIPFLPDWPELVSPFGVPMITAAHALGSDRNIMVIGQPGSGKTVTLAHLASQLARGQITGGPLANAFPIYLHALDLDATLPEGQEPLQTLIRVVAQQVGLVYQVQVPRLLQAILRDNARRIVLILDGLDELPLAALESTTAYLTALVSQHPQIKIITTASSTYADGLLNAGFYPLGVAAWTPRQRIEFTEKWGALWSEQVVAEAKKQLPTYPELDPRLVNNWLSGETTYASPLEWTLRLWAAYAGDGSGSHFLSTLDTHIARWLPSASLMPAMEELAHFMVTSGRASLSYDEMDHLLANVRIAQPAVMPVDLPENSETESASEGEDPAARKGNKQPGVKHQAKRQSPGDHLLDSLTKGGLLQEHAAGQIRFTSPIFLGYLAGLRLSGEEAGQYAQDFLRQEHWSVRELALRFSAACGEDTGWVKSFTDAQDVPLCRNALAAARWLRDAPESAAWRPGMMRALVGLLQNELLPASTRARLAGAFALSGDPSILKLFRQLLPSRSPVLRRVAVLGCGAIASPQLIPDLLNMLADTDSRVRHTACLALAAIPSQTALDAIVQMLLEGDEAIRQAAAEALALIPGEGHQALREAITFNDLLTRRAAVFGLSRINEPWAREALEKTAVADGQWVVRNAAAQALETFQAVSAYIPRSLPAPADSPALIAFASKQGLGISPDQPVKDLLLRALSTGTVDEKLTALDYLRDLPDESAAREMYHLIYSGREELQEPAMHALWWMTLSGSKLPPPMQFGLG